MSQRIHPIPLLLVAGLVMTACRQIEDRSVATRYDDRVEKAETTIYRLYLPDLQVAEFDYSYNEPQRELEIEARVRNDGRRDAGEFDVTAEVFLRGAGRSVPLGTRWQALPARTTSHFRTIGTIPDVDEGQSVDVTILLDPPTAARPGGEIWESDEQDNLYNTVIFLTPAPEGHISDEGHLPDETPPGDPDPRG